MLYCLCARRPTEQFVTTGPARDLREAGEQPRTERMLRGGLACRFGRCSRRRPGRRLLPHSLPPRKRATSAALPTLTVRGRFRRYPHDGSNGPFERNPVAKADTITIDQSGLPEDTTPTHAEPRRSQS